MDDDDPLGLAGMAEADLVALRALLDGAVAAVTMAPGVEVSLVSDDEGWSVILTLDRNISTGACAIAQNPAPSLA